MLTPDGWALEVYRTLMGTLRSDAGVLLLLFVTALFGYLVVRRPWGDLIRTGLAEVDWLYADRVIFRYVVSSSARRATRCPS